MTSPSPTPPSRSDDALIAAARAFRPPEIALRSFSTARVSDFVLGGDHSWAIDKSFVRRAALILPGFEQLYRDERRFRDRAVALAIEHGIRQFLDIGSGLPYTGALHQRLTGLLDHRILYADLDPLVAADLRIETENLAGVGYVQGDLLTPGTILFAESARELLDFTKPICLVTTGILDAFDDDAVLTEALRCYTDRMAPGSLLIASHTSLDSLDPDDAWDRERREQVLAFCASYQDSDVPARVLRDAGALRSLLGDLVLLWPGVVPARAWRRTGSQADSSYWPSLCLGVVGQVQA
ncbi:SAM-dependent methyltransferase [Amycolatopsis sp. PS_44_ISF1]|uniref:SAM-dependent methyltransferase n=1 Tax=Amycolatopsis sp. PS_44_ISF1 TaxID=2974917 RepID=UPI0028DE9E04|nr:SAM-dependent methyltransferase [Amycolatopsis sp. PS_44_ISF1]MDT8913548.1 SAM-dependent methyltransferase [Amycolatopsis sp. PS_44_ISF1]